MSDSLWSHELQRARLSCPSLSPRVCSNSQPLSYWCHPTISSSVTHFSYPQFFPASESCPVSQLFTSGGQSFGALASVLPMTIQGWFPLGLTGLKSLQPKGLQEFWSKVSSPAPQFESINSSALGLLYGPTLTSRHDYWKKSQLWLYRPLSAKRCHCFLIDSLGLS